MENQQPATQPTTAVARTEPDAFFPLMRLKSESVDMGSLITNFAGAGPKAAEFLTQALAKDSHDIRMMGSKTFPTKYYLAHVAEFVAEDGEIIPMPRVVLIAPDGQTLSFVSEGGIRSFDLIRSLCGNGPWDPPLQISVVPRKTRRGFYTYRLCLGAIKDENQAPDVPSERNEPQGQKRRQ